MEQTVLSALSQDEIPNSLNFSASHNLDHATLVGILNSLSQANYITTEAHEITRIQLTEESKSYIVQGSPETQVFNYVKSSDSPLTQERLLKELGVTGKIGFSQAMKNKWISIDPASKTLRTNIETVKDTVAESLIALAEHNEESKADVDSLKKRKLIEIAKLTYFSIVKGPEFQPTRVKELVNLTAEILKSGDWRTAPFKQANFNAKGKEISTGHLHPLLKVREQMRNILIEMGFDEMPTNNYVESGFWNFDSLFQPQAHPARDAHDTFFVKSPGTTESFPMEYLSRVREMHSKGGAGSTGWQYDWKMEEAKKNLLRTHTTAVSARMLYKLAQEGFTPKKYFSIDRVFRNESLDSTHLAEFHQVEGLVADRGLGLADLIGVITEFFRRLGITNLEFKPAYNPYTEPSMEIFGYHPVLEKWTEIGNSGVFRPEMLGPMGLPEDVSVIAWGLSLERPTMIQYKIDNIRDLFGHKISVSTVKTNPICRFKAG